MPYCRPCDALHEESACYIARQILEQGMPEASQCSIFSSEPKFVNNVGHVHPIPKDAWKEAKEYSQKIDNLTKKIWGHAFIKSSSRKIQGLNLSKKRQCSNLKKSTICIKH